MHVSVENVVPFYIAAAAWAGIDPALFGDDDYMDDAQYEAWLQQKWQK